MKEKILVNIIDFPRNGKINTFYEASYYDLYKNFGVKTYLFIKFEDKSLLELNSKYNKFGIFFEYFNDFFDFQLKVKKFLLIHITTFVEGLIPYVLEFKKGLGFPESSNDPNLFRNKKIQRDMLLKYDKNITVNYEKFNNINDLDLNIKTKFSYPFIIKPVSGIQSQLVYKIENDNDLFNAKKSIINSDKNHLSALNNSSDIEILIEEFIDGEMYSIDYYVDENQNIYLTKPVKVLLGPNLLVDDFMNYARILGPILEKDLNNYNIEEFVRKNVLACGIRGTFIHHEFKLNSKGELKTIELNGRIGGYRLEMYLESYNFNIFRFLLGEKFLENINLNVSVFLFYSKKRGILTGFNKKLIGEIKNLKSFLSINLLEKNIGKEVGLTKDGFTKASILRLKNTNEDEFLRDVKFLEENYFNLLIVD